MHSDVQLLIEKIRSLPPERISEVEDFVDFINRKVQRQAALDRILAVAPALEAYPAAEITEEEIQAEVDEVRAARTKRNSGESRS